MNKNIQKTTTDNLQQQSAAGRPLAIHQMEVGFVLDMSPSMTNVAAPAIKGFNTLVTEQRRVAGDAHFSLTCFHSEQIPVYDGVPIADIGTLTTAEYHPGTGGGTALYDGIGTMIDTIAGRTNRSSKVLIAILTDGEENASTKYSLDQVSGMIWHRRTVCGWQFLFLSASPSALKCGQALMIPKSNIIDFAASPQGLTNVMAKLAAATSAYRLGDRRFALKFRN